MADLTHELEYRISRASRLAKINNSAAFVLFALAIGASAIATIYVGAGKNDRVISAILAALPAIIVLANGTFRFDERARFYFQRRVNLEALVLRLKYAKEEEGRIAKELASFLVSNEAKFPGFGNLPGNPKDINPHNSKPPDQDVED